VSLHCNLDKDTHHLMNASRLKMMKPNAVLVNAARGPVIDEAALVAHLKANPEFRWRQCREYRGGIHRCCRLVSPLVR
jgi:hydroxypyruvate reductase 1